MKKIILLCCFAASIQAASAQDKTIDSLKTVLKTTSKPIERFNILNSISQQLGLYSGDIDSATCIQLLELAQQIKNDSLLAISYNLIGQYIARFKGDNTNALDYYFKAIPLAERAHDKRRLSSIYFDIALVYSNLQNNEEAGKYIRKGAENLPDRSHPLYDFMLAQYQRGMATYFVSKADPDSALSYAQLFTVTARKAKSQLFEYGALYLTAAAYELAGDDEMAGIFYKKAIATSDSVRSIFALFRFNISYIPFLLRNHRIPEAKEQALNLLNIGAEKGNNDFILAGAGFMRQAFDSLHNTDSAYYYSRIEATTNATIFNQNNVNKLQVLVFNEQIRLIEDSAKKREEAEQRKHNIQYALIALGIIVLLTLYLLLSRSFITSTKAIEILGVIALLIVFEFLNLLLHPFLERITHHSPVLMLLALVCIAALLVPLHHKLEHWATHKLIEKNKAIRLSAAKKTIEKLDNGS